MLFVILLWFNLYFEHIYHAKLYQLLHFNFYLRFFAASRILWEKNVEGWMLMPITADYSPVNLTQRITSDLRDEILTLKLVPGEKLSEMKVAARYNCSRIPVREAFRSLCMEGCMESIPQVGSFVRHIDRQKLEEIRYVRECLETRVMVDGMKSGCFAPLLPQLQANINQQTEFYAKKEYPKVHLLDDDFHDAFYEAADKSFVRDFMGMNHPDYARARYLSLIYDEHPEYLIRQHQKILNAIQNQSEDELCAAMKEHLTNIYRVLPNCSLTVREYFDPSY